MEDPKELAGFNSWLRSRSPRTAAAYTRDVRRFLEFTQKKPEAISPLDASAWFEDLRTKNYSERSISRFAWGLRKFFTIIGKGNVAALIETPVYVAKEPKWLPRGKIDDLMAAADGMARALFETAYDLALRIGELQLLRTQFFNPNTRQIKVYRLKHKGHPNEYILELSEDATQVLVDYLKPRRDKNPFIFPISTRLVTYYYRKIAPRAHIDPYEYTFHSLRHSRITHIAIDMIQDSGKVDEVRLAKFAGHLKLETTLLYVHLASEYLAFKR